jgi:hypothetical protein
MAIIISKLKDFLTLLEKLSVLFKYILILRFEACSLTSAYFTVIKQKQFLISCVIYGKTNFSKEFIIYFILKRSPKRFFTVSLFMKSRRDSLVVLMSKKF